MLAFSLIEICPQNISGQDEYANILSIALFPIVKNLKTKYLSEGYRETDYDIYIKCNTIQSF